MLNATRTAAVLAFAAASGALLAQKHWQATVAASDVEVVGHVFKPAELPAPKLSQLHAPPGFRIEKFAENVGNARVLAVGPDGSVYVTRREESDVLMFRVGSNGLPSGLTTRLVGRPGLHGITFAGGKVYLAAVHEVFRADVLSDGKFGPLEMIIHDLPDAGQHNTRTIQVGPDNMLYISIGSTCNECSEPNAENASILRASLDGKTRSIFASGLRDTIGWGWHPQTGELWGVDHGIDWLGDNSPWEELNHIEKGKRYGWPYVYGEGELNPHAEPPGGLTNAEWARSSVDMVMGYTAHAAPMQMSFYNSTQFPPEYQGDAFVSMHGSWNRKPPSGYEIARIRFRNGSPLAIEPFITGFLSANGESGRPFGNAIARDGSLLFTDDRNGVIYRVTYPAGTRDTVPPKLPPSESMFRQSESGVVKPLAIVANQAKGKITVTSQALKSGDEIPAMYSSYEQNVSPPLIWTRASGSPRSYAVLVEDPDARSTPLPIVHWLAWNIPPNVTNLREGLPAHDRLTEPVGTRQGMNSMGSVGYWGPKPPAGDQPHHYHFQIFALDRMLDLPPGARREDLLAAMQGHVLASGELVGLFSRPENPARP